MNKIYNSLIALAALLLISTTAFSQMEFHLVSGFGTRFNDINSEGHGVTGGAYYDFALDQLTAMEDTATGLAAINDNDDVAGSMFLDEELFILQPAYRLDGQWNAIGWFPDAIPDESSFTTYGISNNSQYVVGSMSNGCCQFGAFLYDTGSQEFTSLLDTATTYRGYCVNSNGIVAGWLDYNTGPGGTLRQPMYRTQDGEYHTIPTDGTPTYNVNAVNDINDSNVMVGDYDNAPFIYYMEADSFVTFPVPAGYESAAFSSISNNGIVVGFAQNFIPGGGVDRRALIYNPTLGDQPIMLRDFLINNGVVLDTDDGNLGTAYAISANGQYVAGWVNGPPMFAEGWAAYLGDIFEVPTCQFDCPAQVDTTLVFGETSAVIDYDLSYTCDEGSPEDVDVILTSGLPSGSEFPIGTTMVIHQLIDLADSSILASCAFQVTVNDSYCDISFPFVEPITYVEFAGISNSSDVASTAAHEYFLDQTAMVVQGETDTIRVEGFTGGSYADSVAVFFDWNQDGAFDGANEMYIVGVLQNSTGTDGQQIEAAIEVPADALVGSTRMRVSKAWNINPSDPCGPVYDYGQAEDYMVQVDQSSGIADVTAVQFNVYPNLTTDFVNISTSSQLTRAIVYSITGKQLMEESLQGNSAKMEVTSFSTGVYLIQVFAGEASKTFKIVKQ